jgi:manganese transport protein
LDTFLLLLLMQWGIRKLEAFIIALILIIGGAFAMQMFWAKPALSDIAGGFIPSIPNHEALFIAIGIIGATVMPHNLYLHSALVQTRKIAPTKEGIKEAIKFNLIDSAVALNIAFLVNAAILVLAATAFFNTGNSGVGEIKEAHKLLAPLLGSKVAPVLFAIALIAAGQSSTITGTLAGQIVMEGYLQLRINPWARRLITRLLAIIPALIVIIIYGEDKVDALLVLSQVILSLQLGFAIIPLIHFVSDKQKMGDFAIGNFTKTAAWIIAATLVVLNFKMLSNVAVDVFAADALFPKILLTATGLFFISLLFYIIIHPITTKKKKEVPIAIHSGDHTLQAIQKPIFNHIAVALDFSENDEKLISYALGQGNAHSCYYLIHVVESASASLLGKDSNDYETQKDAERLNIYVQQLQDKGYDAKARLGFNRRSTEIIRIVSEANADMLILGAHRHTGLKDILYGETVNSVRHELEIPVLIVNV